MDGGGSAPAPHPFAGGENVRRFFNEGGLVLRRELYHPVGVIGIAEGGEDPAAGAEIRVIPMRRFHCAGLGEGEFSEYFRGHAEKAWP